MAWFFRLHKIRTFQWKPWDEKRHNQFKLIITSVQSNMAICHIAATSSLSLTVANALVRCGQLLLCGIGCTMLQTMVSTKTKRVHWARGARLMSPSNVPVPTGHMDPNIICGSWTHTTLPPSVQPLLHNAMYANIICVSILLKWHHYAVNVYYVAAFKQAKKAVAYSAIMCWQWLKVFHIWCPLLKHNNNEITYTDDTLTDSVFFRVNCQ